MIQSNKLLSRKENGVIDNLKGNLKNMYFTLKSDISLVQYKYIQHTLKDLKTIITKRLKVVEIILGYQTAYKAQQEQIYETSSR